MSDTLRSVVSGFVQDVSENRGAEILIQTDPPFHGLAQSQYVILTFSFVHGYVKNSRFIYISSEKQLYSKNSDCKFGIKYRCYNRNCKSRIIFNEQHNMCIKLVSAFNHNHDDNEKQYKEFVALNNMKKMCSDMRTIASSKKMLTVRDVRKRALEE